MKKKLVPNDLDKKIPYLTTKIAHRKQALSHGSVHNSRLTGAIEVLLCMSPQSIHEIVCVRWHLPFRIGQRKMNQ